MRSLLSDISGIKSREKEIETELSNIAVNNSNIKLLMTIPGINYYSACGIYSEIGNISRFRNREKLASYTGLIPKGYSSGESSKRVYNKAWAINIKVLPNRNITHNYKIYKEVQN